MTTRKKFGPLKKVTKKNTGNLPEGPGVYSLNTDSGKLQYIGKAKRNRHADRIEEHKEAGKIPFKKVGFIPTKTQEEAIRL